jgi:polyhydroxybutyrate depolymerase
MGTMVRRHVVVATWRLAAVACGVTSGSCGSDGRSGAPRDGSTGIDATVLDGGSSDMLDAGPIGIPDADATPIGDAGTGATDGGSSAVACPGATLAAGDYTQTLAQEGGVRTFSIHVPPGLDPSTAAPLVLAFHGGGQNAWQFESFTHIHAKSDSSGFVLVEADGTPALGPSAIPPPPPDSGVVLEVWNAGNCCEYAAQLNGDVDDVGFVGAMIDSIKGQICIDPKRVFATGFSNGGMLSHRLACQMSDRIASIVAVSGGSGETDYDKTPHPTLFPCRPARPVPVLHIHGTQDTCYPFDGGWGPLSLVTFEPVMVTIQDWVTRNGCGSGSPRTVFNNGAASCQLYPCPKQGEVELCTIDGGGHYWPGGDDWGGSTVFCGSGQGARSSDIIANDAFWSWFTDHPML